MYHYWETFINGYIGYATYLWNDITHPSTSSYFYWLIAVSLLFLILEVLIPWRRNQAVLRKDFWLDCFYMFFNFFIFSLIIYNAASDVVVELFNSILKSITGGFDLQASNPMRNWPLWSILLIGFVIRDFVQWWIHRLLHRIPKLWEYHKVHHSVEEMGFAAHLRYHWMENVVYRTIEYLPLAVLGIGLYDFMIIHIFTLAWGHYNHANIKLPNRLTGAIVGFLIGIVIAYSLADVNLMTSSALSHQIFAIIICTSIGSILLAPLMKKIFNSPEMHIWHHAYTIPDEHKYGINFGLTLAIWDYIFGTAYTPFEGKDVKLGFPEIEQFPKDFIGQNLKGIV